MAKKKNEEREKEEKDKEKSISLISEEKVLKYFDITRRALKKAKDSREKISIKDARKIIMDMVENYLSDAEHFYKKKDFPENDEIVMCTVKRILPHSVFVDLDEYGR